MTRRAELDTGARAVIMSGMGDAARTRARLLQTVLGLTLVALGGMFTFVLWRSYARALETRGWTAVPCLITASQVLTERPTPASPGAYRAAVRYRYELGGTVREGSRIRRVDGPSSQRSRAEAVSARYPAGLRTLCFVDPARPEVAILEHATRAGLYTIWFPLLFVAGGAGMLWSAWRR